MIVEAIYQHFDKLCELCDKLTIADEFHFCDFNDLRMKYIPGSDLVW
jgi:hypothetical protein